MDNDAVADFYARALQVRNRDDRLRSTANHGAPDDAHEILSRFGLKADGYCIFIGRIVPEKGVRELIDAYEQLKTDLALVIVGDDAHTAVSQ